MGTIALLSRVTAAAPRDLKGQVGGLKSTSCMDFNGAGGAEMSAKVYKKENRQKVVATWTKSRNAKGRD